LHVKLNKLFITKTIKYNDIYLLYKLFRFVYNKLLTVHFNLYPSIRKKYSINDKLNNVIQLHSSLFSKFKVTFLKCLWLIYIKYMLAYNPIFRHFAFYKFIQETALCLANLVNGLSGLYKYVYNICIHILKFISRFCHYIKNR